MLILRLLFLLFLILGLGVWLMLFLHAIRTGVATTKWTRVRWREHPFFFVLIMLGQLGIGMLILYMAVYTFLALITGG